MKVRVLDQKAVVHSAASLKSGVIAELYAGDEIDVGKTVRDGGAAWVEAVLPDGRAVIERAVNTELTAAMKKEISKAQRALRR